MFLTTLLMKKLAARFLTIASAIFFQISKKETELTQRTLQL